VAETVNAIKDRLRMRAAHSMALSSSCLRRKVGAIIVDPEGVTLGMGKNDTMGNFARCGDGGCPECAKAVVGSASCLCVHAEQRAIGWAAELGFALRGATMYVTLVPCPMCAKQIVACGIKRVAFDGRYEGDGLARGILQAGGVVLWPMETEAEKALPARRGWPGHPFYWEG